MERGSLLVSIVIISEESSPGTKTLTVSLSSSEMGVLLECTILIFTVASVDLTELSEHISLKTLHNH